MLCSDSVQATQPCPICKLVLALPWLRAGNLAGRAWVLTYSTSLAVTGTRPTVSALFFFFTHRANPLQVRARCLWPHKSSSRPSTVLHLADPQVPSPQHPAPIAHRPSTLPTSAPKHPQPSPRRPAPSRVNKRPSSHHRHPSASLPPSCLSLFITCAENLGLHNGALLCVVCADTCAAIQLFRVDQQPGIRFPSVNTAEPSSTISPHLS